MLDYSSGNWVTQKPEPIGMMWATWISFSYNRVHSFPNTYLGSSQVVIFLTSLSALLEMTAVISWLD